MKFKVGDEVLINGPGVHESFKGLTGTIKEVREIHQARIVWNMHDPYLVAIDHKHTKFHVGYPIFDWRMGVITCNEECLHPIGMFKKYIKAHDIMT